VNPSSPWRHIGRIALALGIFLVTRPVGAQQAPTLSEPPSDLSPTTRASFKTATFQTAANLSDVLVFGALVGATATTSMVFLVANTASAIVVYFPYELAWDTLGPPPETTTTQTVAAKTAGYQAITGVRNLALSYAFSGVLLSSATFMAAAIAVDAVIYVLNEYAWDIFRPRVSPAQESQGMTCGPQNNRCTAAERGASRGEAPMSALCSGGSPG